MVKFSLQRGLDKVRIVCYNLIETDEVNKMNYPFYCMSHEFKQAYLKNIQLIEEYQKIEALRRSQGCKPQDYLIKTPLSKK